jgi:hypothetical protein
MNNLLENNKEINNFVNNSNELTNEKEQKNFLETTLGKTINAAIDIGLRWVLPDFIENQIIDVKDSLIKGGLKEGIDTVIDKAVDMGKSITGIFTGKFDSISQAQEAVKNGGIIDGISNVLDSVVNKTTETGLLNSNVGNLILKGKDVILDNVSKNIENNFTEQINGIEKLAKYEENWKEYYNNKDFDGMEREYKKIEDKLKDLLPLENTLKQARQIENIHMLIKNNGKDFNLTKEQLELANNLV